MQSYKQVPKVGRSLLQLRDEAQKLPPSQREFACHLVQVVSQLWGYLSAEALAQSMDDLPVHRRRHGRK